MISPPRRRRPLFVVVGLMLVISSACSGARGSADPAPNEEVTRFHGHVPKPWKAIWTARAAGFPTVLAVDDVGTVTAGQEGGVVALDPRGGLQWAVLVPGGPVFNPPALTAETAVIPTAEQVIGLGRGDGAQWWSIDATAARVTAGSTPGDESSVVVVADADGAVALLDATQGQQRWKTAPVSPVSAVTPYVWISGDTAVIAWSTDAACCHLTGIDLASGSTRWRAQLPPHSTVPVVHRGSIVVAENPVEGVDEAQVRVIDVETGREQWKIAMEGKYSPGLHGDAQGRDVVFVDEAGHATLIDLVARKVRWRSRAVYPQREVHPVITGDRVFLTAFETQTVGFDRPTGTLLGKGPLSPPVFVRQEVGFGDRLESLVEGDEGLGMVWTLEQNP